MARSNDFIRKAEQGVKIYLRDTSKSLTQVAKEVRIGRASLSSYLKEKGIELRDTSKKYSYNDDFFKDINTEEKAYWLGFIYADGCVNEVRAESNRIKSMNLEITLKHEDKHHLEKFNKALKGNLEVKDKPIKLDGKDYMSSRITICSTEMCRHLIKHGCTPTKSLTLEFPQHIRPDLLRHFVRGYFDGDGCIQYPRTRITLEGTESFLEDVLYYFECLGVSRTTITQDKRSNHYHYEKNGEQIKLVLANLYLNSKVYLDRKYNMAIAHLTQQLQESKK